MAPRHIPERDGDQVEVIRSFRASGSSTVVSLWDVGADVRLPMLRWGDSIYSAVYEGMRFAVDVYNGRDRMIAIPTYIEGTNLWVGGPADPEACAPSHMWEIEPHQTLRVDALMNPAGQRGRPIVITRTGLGATVGEATFGTDAFRGQLRIYERHPIGPETTGPMVPSTLSAGMEAPLSFDAAGAEESARAAPRPMAPRPAAMTPAPPAAMASAPAMARPAPSAPMPQRAPAERPTPLGEKDAPRGQAGFGAGDEEARGHNFTGIEYHREAMPLLFLRTEMRDDLEQVLRARLGPSWSWQWPAAWGNDWIAEPWMWPVAPTAAHIPVTRPGTR